MNTDLGFIYFVTLKLRVQLSLPNYGFLGGKKKAWNLGFANTKCLPNKFYLKPGCAEVLLTTNLAYVSNQVSIKGTMVSCGLEAKSQK